MLCLSGDSEMSLVLHEQYKFDPEFINGLLDTVINYCKACAVQEYSLKNHQGWKISLKEIAK